MSTIEVPVRTIRSVVAPLAGVEVRDPGGNSDGAWSVSGYAAVYEAETVLFDAYGLRMKEELAAGSFDAVLERLARGDGLVHLNHGHDMKSAIASTHVKRSNGGELPIGGLELSSDSHGLRFFARVDPADPDAVRLAAKMRRGVVNQASFAFTIDEERVVDERDAEDGYVEVKYRIEKVRDLFDVCACAQGAYPQTESHLRSMTAASLRVPVLELGQAGAPPAGRERQLGEEPGGAGAVSGTDERELDGDDASSAFMRKRLELEARARAATSTL